MEQDLQQLEVALVTAHERLTQVTKEVESLEGKKDYLLLRDRNSQASQTLQVKEARKDKQTILFEKDTSTKFSISQDSISTIRKALIVILGESEVLLRNENLSEEGQKQLKQVKAQVWRVNAVLLALECGKEEESEE